MNWRPGIRRYRAVNIADMQVSQKVYIVREYKVEGLSRLIKLLSIFWDISNI